MVGEKIDIEATLEERGSRYGSFADNAKVTQELTNVLALYGKNFGELSNEHLEALHMIFHKIARMVSGDVNYIDNVHDIVGYAKLLEEHLIERDELTERQRINSEKKL